MSYAARPTFPPPRPYGARGTVPRPYYGGRGPIRPTGGVGGLGATAGSAALGGALGAIGGTLGCLLCLSAIGALGLFSCVVAITAYTKRFLNSYKRENGIGNNGSNSAGQLQIGLALLYASLFYALVRRMQRS